jgi:mannosyltransferase
VLTSERLLTLQPPTGPVRTEDPTPDGRRTGWRDGFIVAGFVVVATLLRIPTIGRSYWVDEGISVGIASHPLGAIPGLLRQDGSPPLWYVLLHFWMEAFGTSPVATHAMALLISLAVTPLAYWAGRRLFGRVAGLAAAGLTATNPFLGWYATENRMYTLLVALSLVAVTATVLAVRERSRGNAVLAIAAFVALDYTHNWSLYLTAVTFAYVTVRAVHARDRTLVAWTLAGGAAVVCAYLPWLPSLLEQSAETAAPWAVAPGIGDLFADPATTIGGTAGIVVAPLLVGAVWWTRGRRCQGVSQAATFLVSLSLGTIVIGWLAANVEPSWTVRYLAVTVAPWLLAAAGALAASSFGRRVVVVVCVALSAWSVVGNLLPDAHPGDAKDNAAAVASAAGPELRRGDLVVVTQTEQVPVLAHYLPPGLRYFNPMGRIEDPYVVDWKHIITRLQRADACRSIEPAVDRLPVGAAILEVDPLDPVGASGSAWSRAAHRQVLSIEHVLAADPSLVPVRSLTEGISPKPYAPVIGELFRKVAPSTGRCP